MTGEERDIRDRLAKRRALPTLRKAGMGWYCMGNGLIIHASTPKAAYDAWQFSCCKGYGWEHRQALGMIVPIGGKRG